VWKGTRNLDIRLQRVFTLQEQHFYSEAIGRLLDSAGRRPSSGSIKAP
jgi:hypothetical protein